MRSRPPAWPRDCRPITWRRATSACSPTPRSWGAVRRRASRSRPRSSKRAGRISTCVPSPGTTRSCTGSSSSAEIPRARESRGAMDQRLTDLLSLLELERLELDLFRGASRDIGAPQVFGGQVLGQALSAAAATVEGRIVHSLHAYFLRRGDINAPIVYQVDRSLDGHSFTNRRVVAIQHGEQIFNMTASFQVTETGFEHQIAMPQVPAPESLPAPTAPPPEVLARLPTRVQRFFEQPRPFEFRMVQPIDFL